MSRKVLISGAGVAGMALAKFLRCSGYQVTVVERARSIRTSGYAIDFRGEAINVLRDLGILFQTQELDTQMRGTSMIDAEGCVLGEIPAERFGGDLEVPKPLFTQLLHRRSAPGVDYVFEDSVKRIEDRGSYVDVEFENGESTKYDLVFGADGINSAVRRLVFDDVEDPVIQLGMAGAGFSTENFLDLDHRGIFQASEESVIYLFSADDPDRVTVSLSFSSHSPGLQHRSRDEQKAATRGAFAEHGGLGPRLLDAMDSAEDFYFSTACQVCLEEWSRGRVVLLGDAAYCAAPTSGMGASQALLGAQRLAAQLEHHGYHHEQAFVEFERSMRDYIAENQRIGREAAVEFGA
jgi:2-polyprenyl-6-methoxyphenol hydroxylase-like FAD-dependent oxidoreductase